MDCGGRAQRRHRFGEATIPTKEKIMDSEAVISGLEIGKLSKAVSPLSLCHRSPNSESPLRQLSFAKGLVSHSLKEAGLRQLSPTQRHLAPVHSTDKKNKDLTGPIELTSDGQHRPRIRPRWNHPSHGRRLPMSKFPWRNRWSSNWVSAYYCHWGLPTERCPSRCWAGSTFHCLGNSSHWYPCCSKDWRRHCWLRVRQSTCPYCSCRCSWRWRHWWCQYHSKQLRYSLPERSPRFPCYSRQYC